MTVQLPPHGLDLSALPAHAQARIDQLQSRCADTVSLWHLGRAQLLEGDRVRAGAPEALVELLPGRLTAAQRATRAWIVALKASGIETPPVVWDLLGVLEHDRVDLALALGRHRRVDALAA